jgi:hypothetical protein
MCMPFDFIDGLKDKKWTHIDKKWLNRLMKHLKKAQSSNIKQIRFIRHIGRHDIYDSSREYEIEDDWYIYEVFLENNITHYVNFGQINDIIGDEEWLQQEGDCLCNIASSRIIYLSLGAKKKESTNSDALCICVGDCVSVENHGKHWIHLGHIISIDKKKTAVVKWEETQKKDTVHLGDCKMYNKLDVIPRKHKETDFFCEISQKKRGKPPPSQMKNMFFSDENLSKLCTEGAIQNLLNMLHFLPEVMNIFCELATSDLFTLMKSLNESYVPKAVSKPSLGINSIQKCL